MNMRPRPVGGGQVILALACLLAAVGRAPAAEPKYASLAKLEAAQETLDYKQRLRDGGGFGDAERAFLTQLLVPQLGLEANRTTIERVRRRLAILALGDATDAKAFDAAATALVTAAASLARSRDAEPVVRLNAMLLLAELKGKDLRPLPAALPALVAAAGDERLPADVRIAAASGIGRHVDAAKAGGDVAAVTQAAAPALLPMLYAGRSVAGDWLAARALSVIQSGGGAAATKEMLAAAAALLASGDRPLDLRVRAAAVLGVAAPKAVGMDAAKAIGEIRDVALTGLRTDAEAARRLREERGFEAGVAPAGGQGGGTAPVLSAVACRRNAWRLWTCADAIAGEDGAGGLAKLLGGEAAPAAVKLAATLRAAAKGLDANPDEQSVEDAIARLTDKPAVPDDPAAERPAPRPAAVEPGQPDNPFGP